MAPPRGMPGDWYEEDEWHESDWHRQNSGYRAPRPPPRRSGDLLDVGYGTSSSLRRSRSTGAAPAPNVYVYTSQHNDNERSPSPDGRHSRNPTPRGRRDVRTAEIVDKLDDIDFDIRRLSRGRAPVPEYLRDPSPGIHHMELELAKEKAARERLEDRLSDFDDRRGQARGLDLERLRIADLRAQKLEDERLRAIEERDGELYKKKLELRRLKDRIEREEEEARLSQRDKDWKAKLDMERLKEEQKRRDEEIRRTEERNKILAQEKDKAAQAKAERDRIKLEIERKEREEEDERKEIIERALIKEKQKKAEKDAATAQAVADYEKKQADEKKKNEALREKFRQEEEARKRKDKEEEDKWKAKLKAKEEEEKEKKKAEEKRIEDEMHKKLAKFGFQENQIDAVLNPKHAANLPIGASPLHPRPPARPAIDWRADAAPTYIKVHRSHVDVETLRYFGLPWEYDTADTEFIIILQEMDTHETELLFEHTRKLRRGGTTLLIEERGRHGDKNQYAFVRRRKPSASPSRRKKSSPVRVGLGSLF